MIDVGILIKGQSAITPIPEIQLHKCMTWSQLAKYNVRLLENVQKDCIEQIKALPKTGSTYSIGAADSEVKLITVYITDLAEILDEKDAVKKEKQRSIEAIKQTQEEKLQLEKQYDSATTTIDELREKLKAFKIENDSQKAKIESLTKERDSLQEQVSKHAKLREDAEKEREAYKKELGDVIADNKASSEKQEQELTQRFSSEIESVKQTLKEKDEIITEKQTEIERLTKLNEELGKSGTIPDIKFEYTGDAQIIGVMGAGSYGVSSLVYTLYKLISSKKNCLLIDLDFSIGNLNKYLDSDNRCIENYLKGGAILRQHIIKSLNGKIIDYIGGVLTNWTPYEILNMDWSQLFEGNYDFILCDCGKFGGYNIQTRVCEMIARNGKMVYLYKDDTEYVELPENTLKVKNFSTDREGIPYVSPIISDNVSLYDNQITREIIQVSVLNKLVNE